MWVSVCTRKLVAQKLFLTVIMGRQELSQKVTMTELSTEAVRQLMSNMKEVYFPLLTNPANQVGWPDVIAKELTENLHRFMAQTVVTMGHMNGETLLPLPPDDVYASMVNSLNTPLDAIRRLLTWIAICRL